MNTVIKTTIKKTIPFTIISVALMALFVGPHTSHAMLDLDAPLTKVSVGSEDATTTPTASANTTPTELRANQATKDTPGTDANYNQTVETILNTVISPTDGEQATSTPAPTPVVKTSKKTKKTAVIPGTSNSSTTAGISPTSTGTTNKLVPAEATGTTSASTTNKVATSTVAGTTSHTPTADENVTSATNYYIPLDSLSPDMTYGLSALAMLFGILGAVLILRDPEERMVWSPTPALSEPSLLES